MYGSQSNRSEVHQEVVPLEQEEFYRSHYLGMAYGERSQS